MSMRCATALSRALDRAGAPERRFLYNLLLTGDASGRELLHRAWSDPDQLCRLEAMRRLRVTLEAVWERLPADTARALEFCLRD